MESDPIGRLLSCLGIDCDEQRVKRPSTVADRLFLGSGCFAEGPTELVGEKIGVVAEAPRSNWGLEDRTVDFTASNDLAAIIGVDNCTDVVRAPVDNATQ